MSDFDRITERLKDEIFQLSADVQELRGRLAEEIVKRRRAERIARRKMIVRVPVKQGPVWVPFKGEVS